MSKLIKISLILLICSFNTVSFAATQDVDATELSNQMISTSATPTIDYQSAGVSDQRLVSSDNQQFDVPTADNMLERIANVIPSFTQLATALAYVFGMYFVGHGVAIARKIPYGAQYGQQPVTAMSVSISILVGAALMFLPSTVKTISATLFDKTVLGYEIPTSEMPIEIAAAYIIIQFFGLMSVIRALFIFKSGQGGNSQEKGYSSALYKGVVHLIAGGLCMNLQHTVEVVFNTLGLQIPFITN